MSEDEIRGRQRLLQQDVLRSTELALKEHFVLQKIAEAEKIDVNDDDINDEIERIADQNDESPRRVRARLEKEDMLETLAAEIIERKALDLILQSAEYEDVPLEAAEEKPVATVEEQAVPGEMKDPTAAAGRGNAESEAASRRPASRERPTSPTRPRGSRCRDALRRSTCHALSILQVSDCCRSALADPHTHCEQEGLSHVRHERRLPV